MRQPNQSLPEEWFIEDTRLNALVAWAMTAVLVLTAVVNFLEGALVTMGLAAVAAACSSPSSVRPT